jgi:hypothetical protein
MIKTPIKIEQAGQTKKGAYYQVSWTEINPKTNEHYKDTIFDQEWVNLIERTIVNKGQLEVKKEKNDKGYWNITELTEVIKTQEPPPEPVQSKSTPVKEPMNSTDRSNAIERAVWWKEVGEDLRSGLWENEPIKQQIYKLHYETEMNRVLEIKTIDKGVKKA